MRPWPAAPAIPRRFHQIWIGDRPDWVDRYWAYNTEVLADGPEGENWSHFRWTPSHPLWHLLETPILLEPYADKLTLGAQTDLIRIEILGMFGGIYMDSDAVLLQSPDRLLEHAPAWVTSLDGAGEIVYNAFLGAAPGSSFWHDFLEDSLHRLQRGLTSALDVAGPHALRRAVQNAPAGVVHDLPQAFFEITTAARTADGEREIFEDGFPTPGQWRERLPGWIAVHYGLYSWMPTENSRRAKNRMRIETADLS